MGESAASPRSPPGSVEVSVILPTYREAENLPLVVPQVAAALSGADLPGEIIVVDDDSPDGTPEVCARLAESFPLRLLTRKGERGLATAVLHGLREARGEILVVMDADLSHPPEKVPELVRALQSGGADFAVGSRYAEGGRVEEGWGLLRRLNSRGATLLARPLARVRDPMSGFFAIRRSALETAEDLDPVGYKILLELLVKCRPRRVTEVPITFSPRRHGRSKLDLREQLRYLRHLGRLYAFKLRAQRPSRS